MHRTVPVVLLTVTTAIASGQSVPTTTIGGYGEMHYNEPDGSARGSIDFHRFVLSLSHTFSDRLSFVSAAELEHTRTGTGAGPRGTLGLEQAYLDYRLCEPVGIRAGILLVPVGLINLYHGPPAFHGVERPAVDTYIIPSTWQESGIGLYGTITPWLRYQAALVAGLDPTGFSASTGIRDGRQSAVESDPINPSLTGRLDITPLPDLQFGASFFAGRVTMGYDSLDNAGVAVFAGDLRYTFDDFSFRAEGVIVAIADARRITSQFGNHVADRLAGYYVEGAWNVLPLLCDGTGQEVVVFGRFERYNTQDAVTGFRAQNEYNRYDIVVGMTYRPARNTAFKCDYTFMRNDVNAGVFRNSGQFNLGIGYEFE